MTGKFYIDGIDAYSRFGVFVQKGGYNGLIQYPPLKKPRTTDWPDEDGIDADLSEVWLDSKEFTIQFCTVGGRDLYGFVDYLSSRPYSHFDFREIGCKKKLRLVNGGNKRIFKRLDNYALSFADDFPLEGYRYSEPQRLDVKQNKYDLDERSFADYGVSILNGSDEEIEKTPAVKKNLLVSIDEGSGATYMGSKVVYQSKDVNIKCLLIAPDTETFWHNYNALLYDLSRPGERIFFSEMLLADIPCYYNSSTVSRFERLRNDRVWCEFTLTLTFTCFRADDVLYLLADYDGMWVISEDNDYYIDVKVYE